MSKGAQLAAILDFQIFTYLPQDIYCANYHASAAIINYLDK